MNVVDLQRLEAEMPTPALKKAVYNDYTIDMIEAGVYRNKKLSIDQMDERF